MRRFLAYLEIRQVFCGAFMRWKKYICLTWIFLGLMGNMILPLKAEEPTEIPVNLYARSAVLMDADSGRVLFGKDANVSRPMASTTKIMTCILALEEMKEGQTAQASKNAVSQPKVRMGVQEGQKFYLEDLLYALMLESYNDSAVMIAEELSGSVKTFVEHMNEKARQLGCKDTHFVTPNGLDGKDEGGIHATTAEDLARIMRYCIMESGKNEEFLTITRTKDYHFTDVEGEESFSCHNHNAFLDMMEGALSGKTGFTADAGYCYVGALRRGERTFIVALLACGWPSHKNYKWKDTRKLMEYALDNYEYREVEIPTKTWKIPVEDGTDPKNPYQKGASVWAAAEESEPLKILLGKDEVVERSEELPKKLIAPVEKGQKAGEILYLLDGEEVGRYVVRTLGSINKYDFGQSLKIVTGRILLYENDG